MLGKIPAMPVLILVWGGFLACLAVLLLGRITHNTFQQRMREALNPTDEQVDEIAIEERDQEMNQSLAHRVLAPILKNMGKNMKPKAGDTKGGQIRDMLEQAGHPLGMKYPEFLALKSLSFFGFLGLGILTSLKAVPLLMGFLLPEALGDSMTRLVFSALWVFISAYVGFSGPTFWLRYYVNKRIKKIRKAMADVVDLIVLSLEAGLGFDQAVGQAVEKTEGPLTEELRRVLDEVRVGRPQSDAFRSMAQRIRMQELSLLVAAIDQAMKMGTGLAHAMRLQATEIRERRMAYVREQAGKLPVKMLLPLVFCIFPALFVVILGPAGVQIYQLTQAGQF
jgi:tight adherence protein C